MLAYSTASEPVYTSAIKPSRYYTSSFSNIKKSLTFIPRPNFPRTTSIAKHKEELIWSF